MAPPPPLSRTLHRLLTLQTLGAASMRRILAPLLLALVLLSVPAAATADVASAAVDDVVLAAAAEGEPLGPDPKPRDEIDNPARSLAGYEDPGLQFTWGAAFILLVVGVVGLVLGLGLWYLLVLRPERRETT